ncbi:acetylornithine deacetylase [Mesorhizobium sp. M7D.F.Ca.US.004.01.2.1]|uniref:acetylornithine deacetylase n=1 Tax=Mesorhizobium sp. M7D.F.Ca.US.004.01.2.1 TaxID=2496738 RepID=UPI0013E08246|nr:acetylornithine deacetylase [Mesorhizobium sp. M7D.F.Ca.US.004.01.2.1]
MTDQNSAIEEPQALLSRLVGFRSVSDRSNLDIADFIETHLAGLGATCIRFPSCDGQKTNLLATIGPLMPGGVVLSGHMDVVPVAGQNWTSDPFALTEHEGALFGRGTTDMKGFVAACLSVARLAAAASLQRPLHFAFSYDEEVGCVGAGPMIDYIADHLPTPACVIVGEPTGMVPVNAHKGAYDWRTVVTGLAAHSSMPRLGAHAIYAGARLITLVESIHDRLVAMPDPGSPFETPHPTLSVGIARGGSAGNIIPAEFSFEWEARTTSPGQAEAIIESFTVQAESKVLPRLQATHPLASIVSTSLFKVPPLVPEARGAAEHLALQLTGAARADAVSFCTEGGLFQQAGLSTVICGPGYVAQAHQPNEYVSLQQLASCQAFLVRLIDHLAADS